LILELICIRAWQRRPAASKTLVILDVDMEQIWDINMRDELYIDMVILDIDMGYGISIWDMLSL
jgi:hypothetical protein